MPAKPKTKRGRPRLPTDHARTVRVTALFTPAEAADITAKARAESERRGKPIPLGEWVRERALE